MDTGANAAWHDLCAGKRRTHRRKRRPLLGSAFLPQVRHSGFDHAKADRRSDRGDMRLRKMFRTIFYPRQRSRDQKTVLSTPGIRTGRPEKPDLQALVPQGFRSSTAFPVSKSIGTDM